MNLRRLRFTPALIVTALPLAASAATMSSLKFLGKLDIPTLISRVINGLLGLTGTLSFAFFVYRGILWMTSQGNDEKIKKAKGTITWATLGLLVSTLAYSGVKFVLSFLK